MSHQAESQNQKRIEFPDRKHTDSLKWAKYHDSEIIPMWVADMEFQSAPEILTALHERIDHGVFGYACPTESTTAAAVNWIRKRHGWDIQPHWIVWVPGLVSALSVASRTFTEPSQGVFTFTPIYSPFLHVPRFWGRELTTCPLGHNENGYFIDIDRFRESLTDDTQILFLCSPHNPVGRVWNEAELRSVAEICLERNIVICSDEIHCDLILDTKKRHLPTATLSEEIAQNTITLMSPAKTFNLPGLNCGFAIIPNEKLRSTFKKAAAGMLPYVNALGYTACKAAYTYGADWLDRILDYLRENQKILLAAINQIPGATMQTAEATYLAWIDVRRLNLKSPAKVLEQAGVGVIDGADFGGPGFFRLNFACSREHLMVAIERIKQALKD